ncbi:hypothetical protein OPIT5_30540 [Opitutaceae bacterium TAV5]|nr:hypothetical protein OPIT5_30540 [Opitutaceae bacterium TAV5]
MNTTPEAAPGLPKLPFFIADAILLAAAFFVAQRGGTPIETPPLLVVAFCVGLGAVLTVVPFWTDYVRRREDALREREDALQTLARSTTSTAEQVGIAAASLHTISENLHRAAHAAEQLPRQLQEKIDRFKEHLAASESDSLDALQQEIASLRSSESEKLDTLLERITTTAVGLASTAATLADADAAIRNQIESYAARFPRLDELTDLLARIEEADARLRATAGSLAEQTAAATTAASVTPAGRTRLGRGLRSLISGATPGAPAGPATTEDDVSEAAPESDDGDSPEADAPSETPSAPPPSPPPSAPSGKTPSPKSSARKSAKHKPAPPPEPQPGPEPQPESRQESAPADEDEPAAPEDEPADESPDAADAASDADDTATDAGAAAEGADDDEASSESGPESEPEPEPVPEPKSRPAPRRAAAVREDPAPGLFDDPAFHELPAAPSRSLSSDGATRLIATAYIGIGNKLYIRGEGPGLRPDKGVPLQFISIGKWRWETGEATGPVRVRLYKNDQIECAALGEFELTPGHLHEVSATF